MTIDWPETNREAIEEVVARHADQVIPVPYMIPGFTDARQFSRLGIDCFGFSPLRIPPGSDLVFSELFHGVDERIPTDGFTWGLRVLYEVVARLSSGAAKRPSGQA